MNLQTIELSKLNPAEYNPRIITKDEFEGLKQSIKTFGQQENLIVNKDMTLISGHQRLNAMLALGWKEATCNVVDLDKHQEKKLNAIMNSTAISGKYDDLKLSEILEELKLDDDYESLRLNVLEPLDLSPTEIEEDEAPEVSQETPVSNLGEIYQLGRHRVMCGDSTDKASVELLMNGERADISFTSPPYNAGKTPTEDKMGKTSKYANDSDDRTDEQYFELLDRFTELAMQNSEYTFVNIQMLSGNKLALIDYLSANRNNLADILIWDKLTSQPAMAENVLNSQFEFVLVFSSNGNRHIGTQKFRGTQSNVVSISKQTKNEVKDHNATYPVEFAAHFVNGFSNKVSIVLDLFLGSGSTLIACEQTDRICYGMELDPKYVDVIRKRYWKFVTGSEEGWEDGTNG